MNDLINTIAMQSLRHRIFSLAPKLRQISQENGDDMLTAFLSWADTQSIVMDWTLHVALLNWLNHEEKWRPFLGIEVTKELLLAAVTRWSLSGLEHVKAKGILLTSQHLPDQAVGLWKNEKPNLASKILLIKLNKSLPDGYAISYEAGSWDNVKWVAMPATISTF